MVTKKKLRANGWAVWLLITALAGCTPTRRAASALLDGKRLIEQGKYDAAIERLKAATQLMDTNALAWNYLGLAYHHANRPANAIESVCPKGAETKSRPARSCPLRSRVRSFGREPAPRRWNPRKTNLQLIRCGGQSRWQGWLKLGTAQLRLGELGAARKRVLTKFAASTRKTRRR